jgi:hypothetical protein
MPNNFLKLPKELRDLVYHELWLATPDAGTSLLTNHCLDLDAEYRHMPPHRPVTHDGLSVTVPYSHRGLPLWLLTSKKMMEEGVEAFNRVGRIYISSSARFFGCDEDDENYDENADRLSWYNPEAFPKLLPPDKWRRLFLFFDWPQHPFFPAPRRPLIDWDPLTCHIVKISSRTSARVR